MEQQYSVERQYSLDEAVDGRIEAKREEQKMQRKSIWVEWDVGNKKERQIKQAMKTCLQIFQQVQKVLKMPCGFPAADFVYSIWF